MKKDATVLRAVAVIAAASSLTGCASLRLPAPPQAAVLEPPAAWAAATPTRGAATPLTQWWNNFDDPRLSSLIGQALQANPSVTGAIGALRQSRAQADVAAAGLQPQVGTSASAQRGRQGTGTARNSFNVGIDASWEPDIFGAQASGVRASDAGVLASAASLGDVQVSVSSEVALNYINLRNAQARLAIAQDNLALQQETLQITQWRMQAGLVSSLQTEQARTSVEQTRAQLPALQTTIEQTRHALAVLTGQPPAALNTLLADAAAVPRARGEIALDIPAETLRQRPDVRASEAQLAAAVARVAQADAERLPNFRLSGSIGLNALTLGSLGGAPLLASLLAGVTWPLFDGGAAKAQVRVQQAAFDQAESAYRGTLLTALQDVENALVALRGDRERQARLAQAADAASNAALLARQRFSSGLVDFQTVLDTQRTQLSAQDSLASAGADVSADHVRLFKALGGGWDSRALTAEMHGSLASGAQR